MSKAQHWSASEVWSGLALLAKTFLLQDVVSLLLRRIAKQSLAIVALGPQAQWVGIG